MEKCQCLNEQLLDQAIQVFLSFAALYQLSCSLVIPLRTKVAVMSGPAAKRMRGGEFDGTEGDHSVQHVHAGDQEAVAAACHDRLDTLQDQVTEGGERDAITRCPANSAGGGSDHHDDGKGYLSNMLVRCKICYCSSHRNIGSDEFVLPFQTMTIYANVRGMPVYHIRAAESACSVRVRLVSTTDVLHCFEPAVTNQNPYVQLSGSAELSETLSFGPSLCIQR